MKIKRLKKDGVKSQVDFCVDCAISIEVLQAAIYVACGGGFIGRMFAEQPKIAYVDARVGKLNYSTTAIYNMREVIVGLAIAKGLDPSDLPKLNLPNLGVF